jgi:hypothetical protein
VGPNNADIATTVTAASWEQPGEPDTGLVGVRRVRNGLSVTREKVIGGARPHHHTYASTLPRYFPLKDYQGDVRIEEHPNGSQQAAISKSTVSEICKAIRVEYQTWANPLNDLTLDYLFLDASYFRMHPGSPVS